MRALLSWWSQRPRWPAVHETGHNRLRTYFFYGSCFVLVLLNIMLTHQRLQYWHGWDAYDLWWRRFTRFDPYDYYTTNNEQDWHFYNSKITMWDCKIQVL